MSLENPTIEKVEKPAASLSEQFKARRKAKAEKRYKELEAEIRDFFDEHKTAEERINVFEEHLKRFIRILSEEEKNYLRNTIKDNAGLTDKEEFVEKMLPAAKYFEDLKADHLDKFEIVERRQMYETHPTYKELNQLFAYELENDEIRIHVPPNRATPIKDKFQLLEDGLNKLAGIVRDHPEVKRVCGRSWIVGRNPNLLKRLGFEITEIQVSPEGDRAGSAMISREKLLEMYGK